MYFPRDRLTDKFRWQFFLQITCNVFTNTVHGSVITHSLIRLILNHKIFELRRKSSRYFMITRGNNANIVATKKKQYFASGRDCYAETVSIEVKRKGQETR